VIRKVLACVRREFYMRSQEKMKKQGKTMLTEKEIEEIQDSITEEQQDEYRKNALRLFGINLAPNQIGKRLMQKAYLTYATVSSSPQGLGQSQIRNRW
jgi:hypothetical protein